MIQLVSRERLVRFPEFDNHKAVYFFSDKGLGLSGFISIHNTALGPATGGTRYLAYETEDDALRDALNLSRAMTYKCAMADVPYGGGKAVIIANRNKKKTPEAMQKYGEYINRLEGLFSTGEDVGISEADILAMAKVSPYINGLPGVAGDPSPWAARSVFEGIRAVFNFRYGSTDFVGRSIAIKGLGKVGGELARLLVAAGARVLGAEVDQSLRDSLREELPAIDFVSPDLIHRTSVDLYAPCALGKEFTPKIAQEVGAGLICGAANNQLADEGVGQIFFNRGISYVPDYIANSGGLINVIDALYPGGYDRGRVEKKIQGVYDTVTDILNQSAEEQKPTNVVANVRAKKKITF